MIVGKCSVAAITALPIAVHSALVQGQQLVAASHVQSAFTELEQPGQHAQQQFQTLIDFTNVLECNIVAATC
jgi:hypothetical protein